MVNNLLTCLQDFFSMDTLDTRLSVKSTDARRKQRLDGVEKSRWKTLEFKLYYLIVIVTIPAMFKAGLDATNSWNPNYYIYENALSKGWMFGRKVDNTDAQYRFFRDNFSLLCGLIMMHTVLKRLVLHMTACSKVRFDLWFGIIFLIGAHGVNSLRIFAHVLMMFFIAKIFKRQRLLGTLLVWGYGIGSLFINEKFRTLPFGEILSILKPLDGAFVGIIKRWDVFYNFTLLRMISFDMDFLERWVTIHTKTTSVQPPKSPSPERFELTKTSSSNNVLQTIEENSSKNILDERSRLVASHHIQEYSLSNYVSYVLYTPLFIAGPIITFNDYLYQTRHKLPSTNAGRIVKYGFRLLFCILTMELMLHFLYVVVVSKAKAWKGDTPFQMAMIGLFNLNLIWLKLLIPWRLFRLWSLIDGIDPPENMIRCMNNNYSPLAFWRAWHRSYNKWVVRYIYVPLGGSSKRILTSFAVFSFVAIWHDIEMKLLLWGWLIVIFLLPEILISSYFAKFSKEWWYRYFAGVGAVVNIWMMMIANLFGFCLGIDGTMLFLKDTFRTKEGLLFFVAANCALFVAVQLMFEYRAHERRNGVYMKC